MQILNLFPTQIYRAVDDGLFQLNQSLEAKINQLRETDLTTVSNQDLLDLYQWEGYTSYFTQKKLFELSWFEKVQQKIEFHISKYIELIGIELGGNKLRITECFANIMDKPFHNHGRHIHTGAAFSGVYYVRADDGCGTITFEDPSLDHWMHQFKYKHDAMENVSEIRIQPKPGELIVFPGHLPHKVNQSQNTATRMAISFNFILDKKQQAKTANQALTPKDS